MFSNGQCFKPPLHDYLSRLESIAKLPNCPPKITQRDISGVATMHAVGPGRKRKRFLAFTIFRAEAAKQNEKRGR